MNHENFLYIFYFLVTIEWRLFILCIQSAFSQCENTRTVLLVWTVLISKSQKKCTKKGKNQMIIHDLSVLIVISCSCFSPLLPPFFSRFSAVLSTHSKFDLLLCRIQGTLSVEIDLFIVSDLITWCDSSCIGSLCECVCFCCIHGLNSEF